MANNTDKKGALKATAEVVATTSTILVASKTIASVIDSTASSVKDMYAEDISAQESSDVVSEEKSLDSKVDAYKQEIAEIQSIVNESTNLHNQEKEYAVSVEEVLYNNDFADFINCPDVEDFIRASVAEMGEESDRSDNDTDAYEDDAVSIISTEPLDDELECEIEVTVDERPEYITSDELDEETDLESLEELEIIGLEYVGADPLDLPQQDLDDFQNSDTIEDFLSE